MDSSITVACSTFGNRLSGAEKVYLRLRELSQGVNVMIIHQIPEALELSPECVQIQNRLKNDSRVTYIESRSKGLTRSRNIALKSCKNKYLVFTDDDVWFVDDALEGLVSRLDKESDAVCHVFRSLKQSDQLRCIYPEDGQVLSDRQLLRVASFEIVVNCEKLAKLATMMREDMGVGAGTDITMGEETVFVADMRRSGGKVIHQNKILVVHPDVSTGEVHSIENVFSKGVVIRRSFGFRSRFVFFAKDVIKILKDRESKVGGLQKRLRNVWALFNGCYLSRL